MGYYTIIIVLTELLMVAMVLHVLNYRGFKKEQKTWYLLTFGTIMLCAGAEFAVHCGYYDPKYAIPLTVLTVIQFSLAPMLAVLFIGALGLGRQTGIAVFFFSANIIVETALAPAGKIFYFNEEGYFRGESFVIYEIFYVFSLAYLVVCMVLVGRKFRHRDVATICMILVILVAGIIPMTLFKINITYVAIAISASLCYIYYNDLVQQDVMSLLFSRHKRMADIQKLMLSGMGSIMESRELSMSGHVSRSAELVRLIAENAKKDGVYSNNLNDRYIMLMHTFAPMHDIGKIAVSETILNKPGELTREEFAEVKKHVTAGGEMVQKLLEGKADEEEMQFALDIVKYHHEKWDGTGYPESLRGIDIPLAARIMAIADVFDVITTDRCYKKAISADEAFEVIKSGAGVHFDPKLTEVFLNHREEVMETVLCNDR